MVHNRPPLQKDITYFELENGIFNISSPPVGFQQYLVIGMDRAVLIDSGIGIGSLKEIVESITNLPITLVNTHCHPDHAGGNAEFPPALINPADLDVFEEMASYEFRANDVSHMPGGEDWLKFLQPTGPTPVFAKDGQVLDLGGRYLELLFTPGHTHGSLCVYEKATGTLFSGDNIQAQTTTLIEWNSSTVEEFYKSLLKLSNLDIRRIYTGHRPNNNLGELLERKLECAKRILNGASGKKQELRGQIVLVYEWEGTSIAYTEKNIR